MRSEPDQRRTEPGFSGPGLTVATTVLISATCILLTLGVVMMFSAGMQRGQTDILKPLLILSGGVAIALVVAFLDYRHLRTLSIPLLAVAVGFLAAVLFLSDPTRGARRWITVFGFSFQPSELAKLALIIALAHYGHFFQRRMRTFRWGFLFPGIVVGGILLLVFLEPDWGTTVLLAAVSAVMLLVAGLRWVYVLPVVLAGLLAFPVVLDRNRERLERVEAWLHPSQASEDSTQQNHAALYGLWSGHWTGRGLGKAYQKMGSLPDHDTDFILAVVGEELGLVCTLGVVLTFLAFVGSGFYIARRAREPFGGLLAFGLTFLIGLQAFVNVGVVTWLLPNKGLPLPFISRGGSSLLITLVCVGLLISVARSSSQIRPVRASHRDFDELRHT